MWLSGGKCDKSEEATGALWVRQKYAIRSKGVNSCEVLRQQAMKEASRVVTCDGTVIKTMLDGTAEVHQDPYMLDITAVPLYYVLIE